MEQLIFNRNCSDIISIHHQATLQGKHYFHYFIDLEFESDSRYNLDNPPEEVQGDAFYSRSTQVLHSSSTTLWLPVMFPTLSFLVSVRKTLGPQMLLSSLRCLSSHNLPPSEGTLLLAVFSNTFSFRSHYNFHKQRGVVNSSFPCWT